MGYRDFADPIFAGVISKVLGASPFVSLAAPSYMRVEQRPDGCPWHRDIGTGKGGSGHMTWCVWSGTLLLTPPDSFEGGGLFFRDAPDVAVHHYCDLVLSDDAPENEHRVASNSGGRIALLMFLSEVF